MSLTFKHLKPLLLYFCSYKENIYATNHQTEVIASSQQGRKTKKTKLYSTCDNKGVINSLGDNQILTCCVSLLINIEKNFTRII